MGSAANLEQLEETEQNRLKVLGLELMMQADVTSAFQMMWRSEDLSALKCQLEEVTTGQKRPPGRKIVHPQEQVGLSQVSPFRRRMLPGHADAQIQLQRPRNKQARRRRGTFQDASAFARRWCETQSSGSDPTMRGRQAARDWEFQRSGLGFPQTGCLCDRGM